MTKVYTVDISSGATMYVPRNTREAGGYCTIIDNALIHNRGAVPVPAPVFDHTLADQGMERIFQFRGKWYYGKRRRDFCGVYADGRDLVVYCEPGVGSFKIVDGVSAQLGTRAPLVAPIVADTGALSPTNITITFDDAAAGTVTSGRKSYRVAAKTEDGIMPPSGQYTIDVPANQEGAVTISWSGLPAATHGYAIFGREYGNEQLLVELPPGTLLWIDTGNISPTGGYATEYTERKPVSYIYTYVRDVNGHIDESGPSIPSTFANSSAGRRITRDVLNDGFFDQSGQQSIAYNGALLYPTYTASTPAVQVSNAVYDPFTGMTSYTTSGTHGLVTGDIVRFVGFSDPNYSNSLSYKIIKINTTQFAIKQIKPPTDSLTVNTKVIQAKTTIVYPDSLAKPSAGDMIYVESASGTGILLSGVYKVLSVTTGGGNHSVVINGYNSVTGSMAVNLIKWVPGNAYYRWWRIYRTTDAGSMLLVDEVDIEDTYYDDGKPGYALTVAPQSFYNENDLDVEFAPPPDDLKYPIFHYGFMAGISGRTVRWTPVGKFDSWPEVYSIELDGEPVALSSSQNGLIILCTDAPYRLDGNNPSALSLSKTQSSDGCIAPYSVQSVDNKLVYLSMRGIVMFNGVESVCVTANRCDWRFFVSPSYYQPGRAQGFWWLATPSTLQYAYATETAGISNKNKDVFLNKDTEPIPGVIYGVGSYVLDGRYYIYWAGVPGNQYQASGTVCLDFNREGVPITTMGMKPSWVHVNENEEAFALCYSAVDAGLMGIGFSLEYGPGAGTRFLVL